MTLLLDEATVGKVTYYLKCSIGHRFERASRDKLKWCPKCGMPIHLYGLKDSTRYADDPSDPSGAGDDAGPTSS